MRFATWSSREPVPRAFPRATTPCRLGHHPHASRRGSLRTASDPPKRHPRHACSNVDRLGPAVAQAFQAHPYPDPAIITSFPGLSDTTGARLLGEIGDDRGRFQDARALVCGGLRWSRRSLRHKRERESCSDAARCWPYALPRHPVHAERPCQMKFSPIHRRTITVQVHCDQNVP